MIRQSRSNDPDRILGLGYVYINILEFMAPRKAINSLLEFESLLFLHVQFLSSHNLLPLEAALSPSAFLYSPQTEFGASPCSHFLDDKQIIRL